MYIIIYIYIYIRNYKNLDKRKFKEELENNRLE